ncbi:MAG: cell division protein FtsQ/DivIB [Pseudomonadota bacterium]
MSSVDPTGRDYSPSRTKYRIERIWLTPIYRSLIRTGVPLAIVVALCTAHFSKPETQAALAKSVQSAWAMVENRPEFAVNLMRVEGGSDAVAEQVRAALPITFPESSMRMDLVTLKTQIEAVDAVKSADLFLRSGVLEVRIEERTPAMIWRGVDRYELVDATGVRAGTLETREAHGHLPLLLGLGAQAHAPEALEIIASAGALRGRIRAMRWMGQRRWDVMLDRGQIIQLPVHNPTPALERLVALHKARDVLSRDVTLVDLRDGRRPVLRLSSAAVNELLRLRAIADEEEET